MPASLVRSLYSAILLLLTPLLLLRLWRRGRQEPAYRQHWHQRLGFYGTAAPASLGAVWLHAVSLGEMRTAALLLAQWRAREPQLQVLLTCSTATGWAEGEKLCDAQTQLVWLPWDMPGAVRRFYAHFQPRLGLLMETEVWPNLVAQAKRQRLPLYLINARLSAKSLAQALRLAPLARPTYAALAGVLAQTAGDAQRLRVLGSPVLAITGNIKFDVQLNAAQIKQAQALKAAWGQPKIITLASSREGEELLFLEALAQNATVLVGLIPMIVPRHPQRFAEISQLAQQYGWQILPRTSFAANQAPAAKTLLLGDSMGEMFFYYALSDVALMGGSFAPLGGQNLIEALAAHCPVVVGPHTFNFADATELALQAGLAQRAGAMPQALIGALKTAQTQIAPEYFTQYLQDNQGAVARILDLLNKM